ncbi:hypothetical protein C0995_009881 [Termitomyces sp. Mi166|nr:hypothetical protein C0995_009881 [Termitomyces sp. Mi166\
MAKKGKDDTPTANSVVNRDIIQRLNFLYQASVYLNTLPPSQRPTTSSSSTNTKPSSPKDLKTARKRRNKSLRHVTTASELSRSYIATMKSVGQKTTVKIIPTPPTLKADVAANDELSQPASALVVSGTSGTKATSVLADGTHMDIDPPKNSMDKDAKKGRRQKKEKAQARIPPLFARDIGHVVFCGNERVLDDELGDGVYIT